MKSLEIEFYFNRKPIGIFSMMDLFEDPWSEKKQKLDVDKLFNCVVPFAKAGVQGTKFTFNTIVQ